MEYTRKTKDEWVVQGYYENQWCDLTYHDTYKSAVSDFLDYAMNEPQIAFRIHKRRISINGSDTGK